MCPGVAFLPENSQGGSRGKGGAAARVSGLRKRAAVRLPYQNKGWKGSESSPVSTAPGLLLTSLPDSPGKQPKRQMLSAPQSLAGSVLLLQTPKRCLGEILTSGEGQSPTTNICSQLYSFCVQGSKLIPCHSRFNSVFSLIITTASWSRQGPSLWQRQVHPPCQRAGGLPPRSGAETPPRLWGASTSSAAASTQAKSISLPQLTRQAGTLLPLLY